MLIDLVYVWCGLPETEFCKYNKDLLYSVKSVRKFIKWINKIYVIVQNNHKLDKSLFPDGIIFVTESSIVPKKFLPITWNSNVIESWIWKIKDLSEHFIYMCDDMYIGRKTSIDQFFINGTPIMRIYEGSPNYPLLSKDPKNPIPYVRMWENVVENKGFNYTRIQHQVLPYRKSLMKEYYKLYKSEVDKASMNKIRAGEKDFNLLRFTSPLSVMHGKSYLIVTNDSYDFFTESDDKSRVQKILKIKPQFFCINNNNINNNHVYKMLDTYFA